MSDFWAKKLGVQPAPPVVQQPPAAPAGPWWMPKTSTPASVPQTPAQPVQQQPQQPQVPTDAQGRVPIGVLLQQEDYTTTRAQSAKQTARCPECDSDKYFRPSPNKLLQCHDCGYNERFQHSTAGIGSVTDNLPVHAARGQNVLPAGALPIGSVIGSVGTK